MSGFRALRSAALLDARLPAWIFLLVFLYFYFFWRLGWFMQDEGVLYYQYLRTYQGQVPYRDFYTGYPPLVYYLHAWVFAHVGISLHVIRTVMAMVNATSAAGLYAVSRRIAPRGFALVPPALFAVMQPGEITDMGFHNSPYPSWYAVTFVVLGTWTMLRFIEARDERRGRAWLVAAGALGGLAFLSKQNAGIFFLWGATGFLASHPSAPPAAGQGEPHAGRIARAAYLALIPLAALTLVKSFMNPMTLGLFVLPLAAFALAGTRERFGAGALRALVTRFFCLAAGFAAAFGPWLVYFSAKVGLARFLRGLFLVGTDVDRNLYIAFPPPMVSTMVIFVPLVLWAVLARIPRERRAAWMRVLFPAGLAFLAGAILSQATVIQQIARMQFGLGQISIAVSTAIDNLATYLAFPVLALALAVAWRRARGRTLPEDPPGGAFLCVAWIAAASFLLFYPRMDTAHLVLAAPIFYAVGAALLARVRGKIVASFGATGAARLAFHALSLAAILFVVGVKVAPKVYSREMVARTEHGFRLVPTPKVWLRFDRANIYIPVYLDAQRVPIETFRELVEYLRATTREGEPIFAFPALPMVYFVSERNNPTRQDYFFGNNVSFREQLGVIQSLEKARVRTVVIANNPNDYFVAKGQDFTRVIEEYLRRRYTLDRRIGHYDVLRRYGVLARGPDSPEPR